MGPRTSAASPVEARPAVWRSVTSTAAAKFVVMALAGLLGIVSSRLIIGSFGVEAYAQYGLLNGVRNLLPFADLGLGAVVINAIAGADDPRRSARVHEVLVTALRLLTTSGVVIAGLSVLVGWAGWWPAVLGGGLMPGGDLVATFCLVVFGLSLPLGIGVRVLIGMHRNALQTVMSGLVSPFFLVGIATMVVLGATTGTWVALVSYVAASLSSFIALLVAARLIAPQVGRAFRDVPRRRAVRGVHVANVAGPMLVQSIATPVAMQSDRILLSHRTTAEALAEYSFALQIFGLVLQALVAAGVSLWPHFARARSRGEILTPWKPAAGFAACALVLTTVLGFLMPWFETVVADGKLEIPLSLVVANVALVVVQSLNYPVGMYMTDEKGLKFQVVPIVLMMIANLGLSWVLIPPLGPAGPLVGSVIAIVVFQVLPNAWWVNRDVRRRRSEPGARSASPGD